MTRYELQPRIFARNAEHLVWVGGRVGVGLEERLVIALLVDGVEWWEAAVRNQGPGWEARTMVWEEAAVVLVGTYNDVYALDLKSGMWLFDWELETPGPDFVLSPAHDRLYLTDWSHIRAVTPEFETVWYQWVADDGIRIVSFAPGTLTAEVCFDPPDRWHRKILDSETGEEISPGFKEGEHGKAKS